MGFEGGLVWRQRPLRETRSSSSCVYRVAASSACRGGIEELRYRSHGDSDLQTNKYSEFRLNKATHRLRDSVAEQ